MFSRGDLVKFKSTTSLYLANDARVDTENELSWLSVSTMQSLVHVDETKYAVYIEYHQTFPNFVAILYNFNVYYVYYDRIAIV